MNKRPLAAGGDLLQKFRAFALQGNVLDLAVGIVIGIAFKAVVDSLVADILLNFIAAIFGEPNFDSMSFHVGKGVIEYGKTLTLLINFLIVAAVLFALVMVLARFNVMKIRAQGQRECDFCKSFVPVDAVKCMFCTSELVPQLVDE